MADLTITAVKTASTAIVGSVFDLTFSVAGNSGDVTWSIDPALPDGITLNTSTGEISGTPTANGDYSGTLTATDTASTAGTFAVEFSVNGKPVISPLANQQAYVGDAFSLTPTVTETSGTVTWSVSSGTLPAGITLNAATGELSGTPTTKTPSATITLTCADTSASSDVTFVMVVYDAVSVTGTLPNGEVGVAYAFTPTASGGNESYTFTAVGFPSGMTLNTATGKISGTPTETVTAAAVTITATDGNAHTGTLSGSLTVFAAIGLTYADTSGFVGTNVSVNPTVSGGSGSYTYTATGMSSGLSIDASTGVVSGTPTEAGTQKVAVTITDSLGATASTTLNVTIQTPVSLSGTPVVAQVNEDYTFTPTISAEASGGTITVTRTAGAIPDGLTLDPTTGVISGTPTTVGSSTFKLKVSDGTSSSTTTFTVTVAAWITLSGTPGNAIIGKVFTFTPTVASGGAGTITYAATGLASWMALDTTTGTITGTPTTAASVAVVITATDGTVSSPPTTYTITSASGLAVTGSVGTVAEYADVSYTPTISGVADASKLAFTLSSGALPAGLTMDTATGTISGEATVTGDFSVTYTVTDGTTSTTWTTDITVITHVVLSVSLPQTAVGAVYSYSMTGSGGNTTAYVYAASGLPDGITLNTATGAVSGKATTKGSYPVDWSLTDGVSTSSGTGTLVVDAPIEISGTPPTAFIGAAYTFTPTIANQYANGTLGVTLTSGTLPDGLTLNVNTGVVSGTPTGEGASTFTLTASDNRTSDAESFTITVDKAISVSGTPAEGEVGAAYTFTPTVENAAGALTATVDQLPPGLTVDATTGTVTGTPTSSGTTASVITITDGHTTATLSVSFKIVAYIEITGTPDARYINSPFTYTPTITGGEPGGYTYSISDLPDSTAFPLSLDTSTGAISGTPTAAGTYSVKYTVSDGIGSATVTIDLSVAAFSFEGVCYEGVIGKSYRFIPTIDGGSGAYYVTVESGTLPTGLELDPSTGIIHGTTVFLGDTPLTLSATDGYTTLTLSITLSFTDRVVYAIAHRPEHYGSSSVYTSWTESDSTESAKLGYITQSVTPPDSLIVPIVDSKGNPAGTDNISITIEGKLLTCALTAQTHWNVNGYYQGDSNIFAWTFAKYTSSELDGYYIVRMKLSNGYVLLIRWTSYDDGTNVCTRSDDLSVVVVLIDASGTVVSTSDPLVVYDSYNLADGLIEGTTYAQPLSKWSFTIYGIGTSSATIASRSTDTASTSSVVMDLRHAGSVVSYDLGPHNPIGGSYTTDTPPKILSGASNVPGHGFTNFVSTAGTTTNVSTVYYTAAASYKLNKTELYEDMITGLATTVAQFTGDVTEFSNTTPNYNDYRGRYSDTVGQTDSYTFASRAADVGYEPKAVMITAYANTDDDATKASLSAAAVSSDGTIVEHSAQSSTVSSDGSALNFILQKDLVSGSKWSDDAINNNTLGVTRTE